MVVESPDATSVENGLEKLGYKQELSRSRGLFSILFMTIVILSFPYGLLGPFNTSLIGGGPATILWGYMLVSTLTIPLSMSLGEICSKYPTSAGVSYWSYRLSPPRWRSPLSWITGWLNLVGVWMISLSVTFGAAQLIVAGVTIFRSDWIAATWHTYLIFIGVTLLISVLIIFLNQILPQLDMICAIWTLLGIIVVIIGCSVKAACGRHPVSFALTFFDPSFSGWNPGWAFFIGLLPAVYTYCAVGMVTSMCEEVYDPSIQVPKAMVWSIPICAIGGIAFLLPILFTLPDIQILLSVPGGQPIGLMFTLIMGSKAGGFGMWFIVFGVCIFCSISCCCAASRSTWSFARDKGLPFSSVIAQVRKCSIDDLDQLSSIPLYAHLLSTVVQLLLGLLYLGSSTAFNAFVGVGVICLSASYSLPIAALLWGGRKFVRGSPYGLGNGCIGFIINSIALAWIFFQIVLFSMPSTLPVTKSSMNYTSAVFFGFAIIGAFWYTFEGRFHYSGPPLTSELTSNVDHS